MKKKLGIKGFLTINYLVTFAILFIVLKLGTLSANYIVQTYIYKDQPLIYNNLKGLYRDDFNQIDIGIIEELGGWLELLDQDKNVIFVKGEKKDDIMQYSEEELFEIISPQESYSAEKPYFGEAAHIEGKNGQAYTLLLKFDKRKFVRTTAYQPSFIEKTDVPVLLQMKIIGFSLIAAYLLIGISVYSWFSSKFITRPLREFVDGLKNMKLLKTGASYTSEGLKELKEVKDEFNKMMESLEQAEREKAKSDISKKRLLADVSHDLRTPITSIQGFSKLLLEETVTDEEKQDYLKIIHTKSVYTTALIEELFQLSKLEDSDYQLSLIKGDMGEWLKRLTADYYGEFVRAGFEVTVDVSERPIWISFDSVLMKRAFLNLLTNCLIYNEKGTNVYIAGRTEGKTAVFEVSDNGKGIEEAIKDRVFESFVKSHEQKSPGSGLGLAITKKIIEKHGGVISLSSSAVFKTIFEIRLPLK